MLSFAVGLVSLYALLLRRRSILGLLGLASIFLPVLVSAWPEMYFTCANTIWTCATISLSHLGFEQGFLVIGAWTEKLLLATGILLLGVATFRARVLGRWRALPCVVLNIPWAPIITLSLGRAQIPWPLFGLFATLRSLSWVLLGGRYDFTELARILQGRRVYLRTNSSQQDQRGARCHTNVRSPTCLA